MSSTYSSINNTYSIRRDSLISTWGVGAIVPFPHDESLMVAGLDTWFSNGFDYKDFEITDERLSNRLHGKKFVYPPDFRKPNEDMDHSYMRIPAVRFPLWHYCPVCGNMKKLGDAGSKERCSGDTRRRDKQATYCSSQPKSKKLPLLIPERFIAVCEDGHIEDFPIIEWVHAKSNKEIQPTCKLKRSTGGTSSSLSGIKYFCTCGAWASISEYGCNR